MPWVAGVFQRENPTYSGADVWQQDAANGNEVISSSRHDHHDQDLAEGINNCLAKDGSNAMTSDLNFGGNKAINAGAATVAGDVALLGQTVTSITTEDGVITFVRTVSGDLTVDLPDALEGVAVAFGDGTTIDGKAPFLGSVTVSTSVPDDLDGEDGDIWAVVSA